MIQKKKICKREDNQIFKRLNRKRGLLCYPNIKKLLPA